MTLFDYFCKYSIQNMLTYAAGKLFIFEEPYTLPPLDILKIKNESYVFRDSICCLVDGKCWKFSIDWVLCLKLDDAAQEQRSVMPYS